MNADVINPLPGSGNIFDVINVVRFGFIYCIAQKTIIAYNVHNNDVEQIQAKASSAGCCFDCKCAGCTLNHLIRNQFHIL